MTQATIATEVHQTLDVHGNFATQIAFNEHVANPVPERIHFLFRQFVDLDVLGHSCIRTQAPSLATTHTEDVCECHNSMLVVRYIDADYSGHSNSPINYRYHEPGSCRTAPVRAQKAPHSSGNITKNQPGRHLH